MRCSIEGCSGEYETREIVHTIRPGGRIMVIDHVPADVCSVCGDTLLRPETVRHIDHLLKDRPSPVGTAPLYSYA